MFTRSGLIPSRFAPDGANRPALFKGRFRPSRPNRGKRLVYPLNPRPIRATLRSPKSRLRGLQGSQSAAADARHSQTIWTHVGSGGYCNEGHRRTRATPEIAGPRASRGRAAQHHPDPRQRAAARRERAARAEGDRSRSRGDGDARRRDRHRRLDHGSRAHVLRHRAQAARRLADRARRRRRPLGAGDPRRPLALHPADAARERLSRSCRRRHDAFLHAAGRRRQTADRPHPVCDLDRRDALLSQRHLSAHRRQRQGADPARRRHRRSSSGADRSRRCPRARPACPA